ncbi:MAG: GNAT family N-acetyltransferase [Candidatus Eisenbacteria bacterium]
MLDVREFSDLEDHDLTSAWIALESSGACPNPFASHVWVRAWTAQFASDATPSVFVGYDGGTPVALAPLLTRPDGTVELPTNFLSLRGEFLLGDGEIGPFVAEVLGRLRGEGRELVLRSVPADSRTRAGILACAKSAGYLVGESESRTSPYVELEGSWDDYAGTRTTKRVARWRKRVRKIEKIEGMSVRRFDESTDVDALVDAFIDTESRSWKERHGTSIRGRGLESFYHTFCRALAHEGWFAPVWLERDGDMFAFLLTVVYGGAMYALKTSFDEKYSEFSPGTPLFYYTVTDGFERGYSKVDFLGEPSRWKSEWATGHREHVNIHMRPAGLSGAVKHLRDTRVKPVAKKLLRKE